MPRLSIWYIRTALLYLGIGFTLGALMLYQKGIPLSRSLWRWLPTHIEFLLIGWLVQLALGVSFWILPRFIHGPARGNEQLAWAAYLLINLGVLSAGAGQGLNAPPGLIVFGRVAEMLAALLFALQAWPRIKPHGV